MTIDAIGGVVSLANTLADPPPCRLYAKLVEGDLNAALTLHYKLYTLSGAVSGSFALPVSNMKLSWENFTVAIQEKFLMPMTETGKIIYCCGY